MAADQKEHGGSLTQGQDGPRVWKKKMYTPRFNDLVKKFIEKTRNVPNVPQLTPVERLGRTQNEKFIDEKLQPMKNKRKLWQIPITIWSIISFILTRGYFNFIYSCISINYPLRPFPLNYEHITIELMNTSWRKCMSFENMKMSFLLLFKGYVHE